MIYSQLQIVHMARRSLSLDEADYRLILRNVGKVESSKDLSNAGLEDVMAFLESRGFVDRVHGKGYWQGKVDRRGRIASSPQLQLLKQLARESRYDLGAMCRRFSDQRTDQPGELTPTEAHRLIEMFKGSAARDTGRSARVGKQAPTLFGG